MPIKSYLAYPVEGKKDILINELSLLKGLEILPSDNKDLLILVSDTDSIDEDIKLEKKLAQIDSLKFISLVYGHTE